MTDLVVVQRSPTILVANGPAVPVPHGLSHGPAGTDPLSAYYASLAHASQHAPGGTDELYDLTKGSLSASRFECTPRGELNAVGGAVGSGQMMLNYFTAPAGLPAFTKIGVCNNTTLPTGQTLIRMGLFSIAANGNGTLVARIANDTTLFSVANTVYTRLLDATGGFPTSITPTAGQRYAWALIGIWSNSPTFPQRSPQLNSIEFGWPIQRTRRLDAQTDLPLSFLASSLNNAQSGLAAASFLDV